MGKATKDTKDLMKLDRVALMQKVGELKSELVKMKFDSSVSGLEKPHKIKGLKKRIAQCLTVYNSKAGK